MIITTSNKLGAASSIAQVRQESCIRIMRAPGSQHKSYAVGFDCVMAIAIELRFDERGAKRQ